jgi:hypothetical protein
MIQVDSTISTQNHHSTIIQQSPLNNQQSLESLEVSIVTDQERQKAEELVSRLEIVVGQIFPRDGGNAALITTMIQALNGLRSLLGIVRPH